MASPQVLNLPTSKSFEEAVRLMNNVPADKLPILFSHIIQRTKAKESSLLRPKDEEQLSSLLGVSSHEVSLLGDGCAYIAELAAYHLATPELLQRSLENSGLVPSHSAAIAGAWEIEGKPLIKQLAKSSFGAVPWLTEIDWRLHLRMSDSKLGRQQETTTLLELLLTAGGQETNTEKLLMEFSHQELYEFFLKLEAIQDQIDSIVYREDSGAH